MLEAIIKDLQLKVVKQFRIFADLNLLAKNVKDLRLIILQSNAESGLFLVILCIERSSLLDEELCNIDQVLLLCTNLLLSLCLLLLTFPAFKVIGKSV